MSTQKSHRNKWTADEVAYLRANASHHTITYLVLKFDHRHNENSIKIKCQRLGITRAPRNDGYTLQELAEGLEIPTIRRIYGWIKKKWLRGTRQGPDATTWNFIDVDIKHFLQQHPEEVSPEVMNSLWVQDLLYESYEYGMGPLASVK